MKNEQVPVIVRDKNGTHILRVQNKDKKKIVLPWTSTILTWDKTHHVAVLCGHNLCRIERRSKTGSTTVAVCFDIDSAWNLVKALDSYKKEKGVFPYRPVFIAPRIWKITCKKTYTICFDADLANEVLRALVQFHHGFIKEQKNGKRKRNS
jgi:hypothetical protein